MSDFLLTIFKDLTLFREIHSSDTFKAKCLPHLHFLNFPQSLDQPFQPVSHSHNGITTQILHADTETSIVLSVPSDSLVDIRAFSVEFLYTLFYASFLDASPDFIRSFMTDQELAISLCLKSTPLTPIRVKQGKKTGQILEQIITQNKASVALIARGRAVVQVRGGGWSQLSIPCRSSLLRWASGSPFPFAFVRAPAADGIPEPSTVTRMNISDGFFLLIIGPAIQQQDLVSAVNQLSGNIQQAVQPLVPAFGVADVIVSGRGTFIQVGSRRGLTAQILPLMEVVVQSHAEKVAMCGIQLASIDRYIVAGTTIPDSQSLTKYMAQFDIPE